MNIYKVTRTDNVDCDNFDSFVCYAESEDAARVMNPDRDTAVVKDGKWVVDLFGKMIVRIRWAWIKASELHTLKVELLGVSDTETEPKFILASFKAGSDEPTH